MAWMCDRCEKSVNLTHEMHGWYFVEARRYVVEGSIARTDPIGALTLCSKCGPEAVDKMIPERKEGSK